MAAGEAKKLVVKVDPKTKGVLDEYKKARLKELTGGASPKKKEEGDDPDKADKGDNDDDDDDYMDGPMRHEDAMAKDRIRNILSEHSKEMSAYVPRDDRKRPER